MANRRVSRTRIGVTVAGAIAASLLLTAVPQGQQQAQGRGRAGQVQTPPVPTGGVPQIRVPTINVPDATRVASANAASGQAGGWVNQARMRGLVRASELGLNYVPGEVLVKFKDGVGAAGQNRALSAMGSTETVDTIEWSGGFAVMRDERQPNAYLLADQMKAQPEVEYAEPNFIAVIDPSERAAIPTPPSSPVSPVRANRGKATAPAGVPTDTDYAAYQWNFQLISMPTAWDLQPGGSADIIVAVIDSGITATSGTMTYPVWTGSSFQTVSMPYAANPDLPASRHIGAKDYIGPLVPGSPHVDTDGHATHVSSTIGETTNNALLVSGVAYNVRIMPIKVCTSYWDRMVFRAQNGTTGFDPNFGKTFCTFADIADAVEYAVNNGARVLNISLGGTSSSTRMQSALVYAAGRGGFVSISMGNDFNDGNPTSYPAFYAGSIDGVMSVGSVGPTSAKAGYSSTGAHCEIAAPGGDSVGNSGRLDKGVIWQSTLLGSDMAVLIPRFDRYDKQGYSGTSMAAPHVAGVAALLMSQMPLLTGAQVERILRMTAMDLGAKGKDDSFGYGLIQPRAALFGYGINR